MRQFGMVAAVVVAMASGVAGSAVAQQKASPRDSVKATIGGGTVSINYGRPSMRGREIMGGLVPWGQVWRTGANEATTLVTTKALMFGSVMVPAGTYTLYTLPGKDGWKLIINKQTGQWGTEYHQEQDLARVDMKVEALTAPVEMFTIKIEPKGGSGILRLEWEKTAAVVSFMAH